MKESKFHFPFAIAIIYLSYEISPVFSKSDTLTLESWDNKEIKRQMMEVLDDTVQNFNFVGMSDLLNLNFRLEVLMKVKIIDTYITEDYSNLKHSQVKKRLKRKVKYTRYSHAQNILIGFLREYG
ncbi:MAG: hypothetical protein HWD61_02720 [Parachlamydiaceae bacterium]|nr:MAG: hypothetical protein HWD61_02720 [Parachlamydiaceae bacterium]